MSATKIPRSLLLALCTVGLLPGAVQHGATAAAPEPVARLSFDEPEGKLTRESQSQREKQCLVGSSATLSDCVEMLRSLHCFTEEQLETITWENPMNLIGLFS